MRRWATTWIWLAFVVGCSAVASPPSGGDRADAALLDVGALMDDDAAADGSGVDGEASDAGFVADAGLRCGPHGEAHGDHCDCHRGYHDRDGVCVAISECMGDDPYEPDDRPADAVVWNHDVETLERHLCPGDRDWIAVDVALGETLELTCRFSHLSVDLDLALWEPGRDPRFDGPVARASSGTDVERVVHRVRTAGVHLLRISSSASGDQGPYIVSVTRLVDGGLTPDGGVP